MSSDPYAWYADPGLHTPASCVICKTYSTEYSYSDCTQCKGACDLDCPSCAHHAYESEQLSLTSGQQSDRLRELIDRADESVMSAENALALQNLDRLVWIGVGVSTIILLAVTTGLIVREAVRSS